MKKWTSAIAAVFLLASAASAEPINLADIVEGETYRLANHPNGSASSPYYGLRLDGLFTGNDRNIFTFDFEASDATMDANVEMVFDGSNLSISGYAFGGRDIGSAYDPNQSDWWYIDYTYTNVFACGSNLCWNSGDGTIASDLFGTYNLDPTGTTMHGYTFQLGDGHRGVPTASGWGWLNHCLETAGSVDVGNGAQCTTHEYYSDWLFTVHDVPEPGTLALLGAGLLGLGLRRRMRATV